MKTFNPNFLLFTLGFVGVLSLAPLTMQLLATQPDAPAVPVWLIQFLSIVQPSIMLFLMVWLGSVYSRKVGLRAPVIEALSATGTRDAVAKAFRPQVVPGLAGGVLGGAFLAAFYGIMAGYLPAAFRAAGEGLALPWYTKLLYGGITEEILVRWGVMSFLAWLAYRITQRGPHDGSNLRAHNIVIAIVLSALVFAAGHLPAAFSLAPQMTASLLTYILVGNASFGLIAGVLYWRRGLECAILAHMTAHLTMIAIGALT